MIDKENENWQNWDWSAHNNCQHIPNAETIAAMEETEEILRKIRAGEYSGPSYDSFEEMLAEIDAEIAAEEEEERRLAAENPKAERILYELQN
ncbi:MAG: hypothetical protein FWG68_11925 [Defluviitaleaceae bacterium]|nr:hypothetical protein [Defluviitaleaceae bacterium]